MYLPLPLPIDPLLLVVCATLGFAVVGSVHAESSGRDDMEEATVEFVADVSGGNEALSLKARMAFEQPDRRPEASGFYLSDDVSDEEIGFRTAITALAGAGHIFDFEDKYANEMLYLLVRNETVLPDPGALSRQTRKFADQLSDLDDEPARREPATAIRFEASAREIEALAASQGRYLLSLDLGGGDTHFIIPVDRKTYVKWRDVAFGPDLAVTAVAWSLIWESIAYTVFDTEGTLAYEAPTLRRLEDRRSQPSTQGM